MSVSEPTRLNDSEQDRMMEEECLLVDDNDKVIGKASKRLCHQMTEINNGMLHRAFSVFLFNSNNDLLLQQRASVKPTFALRWTNTCCSHPLHGTNESEEENHMGVKRAAIRKLEHELGITDLTVDDLHFLTRIIYRAGSDGGYWGEHEIDHIMFVKKDVKVNVNSNECEAIRYVNPEQLKQMFVDANQKDVTGQQLLITPWFQLIAEKFLFNWWPNVDTIIKEDGVGAEQAAAIHDLRSPVPSPTSS